MFSRKKEKEPKEKKKEIIKETLSVLPIRNYDEGIDAFSLEDEALLGSCNEVGLSLSG